MPTGGFIFPEGAIIFTPSVNRNLAGRHSAQLLRLTGGEFRLAPFLSSRNRRTIDDHWEGLLMDAAQASDEQTGDEAAQKQQSEKAKAEKERATDRRVGGNRGGSPRRTIFCTNGRRRTRSGGSA